MEFTIGSPKQLGDVLFGKLQLPSGKKGKSGALCDRRGDAGAARADASRAAEGAGLAPAHQAQIHLCRRARRGDPSGDGPRPYQLPARHHLDRAALLLRSQRPEHSGAHRGRAARSARPFVAEPGHVLLSADYSQIELRLAAHMAEIDALKEAFRRGDDILRDDGEPGLRRPHGRHGPRGRGGAPRRSISASSTASAPLASAPSSAYRRARAAAYIKAYFERFPGIRVYMEKTKEECREQGFVETLFGRKCYIPGIRDGNVSRRNFAERQAINAPLQGTAADIIKRAMTRLPATLAASGLKAKMLLQVHDELLFETPESEAAATAGARKGGDGGGVRAARHALGAAGGGDGVGDELGCGALMHKNLPLARRQGYCSDHPMQLDQADSSGSARPTTAAATPFAGAPIATS